MLHECADRLNTNEALEYMIEKGADVNFKNKDGKTPLFFAVRSDNSNSVRLLISKGAEVYSSKI